MQIENKSWMRQKRAGAFTLIELLVVIAIIAIVAGLIVNLAGRAATSRKLARVRAELAGIETAIDSYKAKKGFYPPSNGKTNNVVTNQLFYELTGTIFNNGDFKTINGDETIAASDVNNYFNVDGFANSATADNKSEAKNFFPGLRPSQYAELKSNPDVELLVVPVEGPDDIALSSGKKINPWRYNSAQPTHNPDSYDLWAEIVVAGKTNIIGNWKD